MVKQVLLLGSGFVAKPTVDIFAKQDDIEVTVGCRTLSAAKALAGDVAKAISVDATNQEELNSVVKNYDLVISLIPYIYHANVVKAAIASGKTDVVTTSYINPTLRSLEPEIKNAGIDHQRCLS